MSSDNEKLDYVIQILDGLRIETKNLLRKVQNN
jgi:hypothetical protein